MRILLILTEFPPSIGGMQTHALLLSKTLHSQGHEMEVYTYRSDLHPEQARAFDSTLPFPVHRVMSRIGYVRNLEVLSRAAASFRPDIIYSSTIFYGTLHSITGIPVVARSVGNDVQRPWIVYPFSLASSLAGAPWLDRKLYKLFRKLEKPEALELLLKDTRMELAHAAARLTGLILANSDYTRRLLLDLGVRPSRISVVVGGVDSRWFRPPVHMDVRHCRQRLGLPAQGRIILTACRLVEKKGLDLLMESMLSMPDDTYLVIVGDGKMRRKLLAMRKKLRLDQRVIFTGPVPYEHMRSFYWASDLFVLASREYKDPVSGLVDAETMGRVLCEANAAGIPVVAARSGGIPSVIAHGRNGLLFREDDRESLLAAMGELLEDVDLRETLVRGGLYRAEMEFDWKWILEAHYSAFRRVLTIEDETYGETTPEPRPAMEELTDA